MKHKYAFYFYPEKKEKHGKITFYENVKSGKQFAENYNKKYDYVKIY